MRFLHTADWHLGKQLHGASLIEDQSYVLDQFCSLLRDAAPDCVVVAGDVFDRSIPPVEAMALFDDLLARVAADYHKPFIVIGGNHDSPERLQYGARLFARSGIHIAGAYNSRSAPLILEDKAGKLAFCSMPYLEPAVAREKLGMNEIASHQQATAQALQIFGPPRNCRAVLIAHAFVCGGVECESERPLSVGGSAAVDAGLFADFHCTLLGHLHQPQQVTDAPIYYAGSLLKYSFSETGHQKSFQLIDMDGNGCVSVERVPIRPRRDVRRLSGYFDELLQQDMDGKNDYLLIELQDQCPILDAMARLRAVYPNLLQISRPFLQTAGAGAPVPGSHSRQDELSLFEEFVRQTVPEVKLDGDQIAFFRETVAALKRGEQET